MQAASVGSQAGARCRVRPCPLDDRAAGNLPPFGVWARGPVAAICARLPRVGKPPERRLAGNALPRPVVLCLLACVATVGIAGAAAAAEPPARRTATPQAAGDLYVSPTGSDSSSGRSPAKPLRTIQAALARATAGTTVRLAAGTYAETPRTVRDGTAAAPITIRGPGSRTDARGRALAVVVGTGHVFNIDNSHYRLEGFTIDGQPGLGGTSFPTGLSEVRGFKDSIQSRVVDSKLLYIGSGDSVRGVNDVVVRNLLLRRAGGECLRIRNDAYAITVSGSLITWCGMQGTGDDVTGYRYHNGEGVYIGTSPKSAGQPLAGQDGTNHVTVRGNVIRTYGSECVDVKEQASFTAIVANLCAGNDEPARFWGSLIELRGHDNSVESNTLTDSRGYGVKVSSDDPSLYSIGGNVVRGNRFAQLAAAPLRTSVSLAPGSCGNSVTGSVGSIDAALLGALVAACPPAIARSG